MKLYVFILLSTLSLGQTQNSSAPLSCYVCDSVANEECRTNPHILQAQCNSLDYNKTQTASTRRFAIIFKRQSTAFSLPINTQFTCIKATMKENDEEHLVRSCVPLMVGVANVCDYLKNELDSTFTLRNCYSCASSLCNEATTEFNAHGVKFVMLFTLFMFLHKLLF